MSQITTHILNTSLGKPAADVAITLLAENNGSWSEVVSGVTNHDGRVTGLLDKDKVLSTGSYKLRFETGIYFAALGIPTFYPYVEIVFHISDAGHYHVPLLLNPYGYSTYRGS